MSETERNNIPTPDEAATPAENTPVAEDTPPVEEATTTESASRPGGFCPPDPSFTCPVEAAAESTTEPPLYRWVYSEHDKQDPRPRRKGVLMYAIIMTAVFVLSFALLLAVLWVGRNDPNGILRPGITADHDDTAIDGVEQAKHSVVVIETVIETAAASGTGTGTGIILTADGYIATNHHVIENASEVWVTFYDGRSAKATVVGSSEMDDLAVIKVTVNGLTPATFAYDENTYVGETVYAIGTPGSAQFAWTTTKGIISYKDRDVKIYNEDGSLSKKLRLLQTDAKVNPGNSGGPLVNTKGEVVGVVSMKLAEGFDGIGFAIPSDGAVEILHAIMDGTLDDVQSSISHKRPMLGIVGATVEAGKYYIESGNMLKEISEREIDLYNKDEVLYAGVSGVMVMDITEGMDAAGKLRVGDIITAVEGRAITVRSELSSVINEYYAGDTVTLTYYRGSLYTDVEITLSAEKNES